MAYSKGHKCFFCKKVIKEENGTWGRMAVKGKYITKAPHWFHKLCWKEYAKKYGH